MNSGWALFRLRLLKTRLAAQQLHQLDVGSATWTSPGPGNRSTFTAVWNKETEGGLLPGLFCTLSVHIFAHRLSSDASHSFRLSISISISPFAHFIASKPRLQKFAHHSARSPEFNSPSLSMFVRSRVWFSPSCLDIRCMFFCPLLSCRYVRYLGPRFRSTAHLFLSFNELTLIAPGIFLGPVC